LASCLTYQEGSL